jgi:hypothetical protein
MDTINNNKVGIVVELSEYDFRNAFEFGKDSSYNNAFSYEALGVLFEYYWELSECEGDYFVIDPIAIIGLWTEFENEQEVFEHYGTTSLNNLSSVLEVEGGSYLVPEQ